MRFDLYLQWLDISSRILIQVKKADRTFLCILTQFGGEPFEVLAMILHCIIRVEKDWIITPDYPIPADRFRQLNECRNNRIVLGWDIWLDIFAVGIQGKLKIEIILFQLVKTSKHWNGVFCPEDKSVNHVGRQTDSPDLMRVHGIADQYILFLKTIKEPL